MYTIFSNDSKQTLPFKSQISKSQPSVWSNAISKSLTAWFPECVVKEQLPLTHIREARRMRNESLHLIIERTFSLRQPDLFAIFSAINLWNFKQSLAIPPFTENTNGVNEPCFIILLLYWQFFYFSSFVKIFSDVKGRWDLEFVLVILTKKKAFCPSRQNPLARTSGFALTPVKPLMISPSSGCSGGSISTSLQISVSYII